ncbi:MAG: UDP-N-acetylmuramate dehydrogenase [Ilumatobacter sp.]|uniref:UDP-N-acetylmuramate dehydrogenase n=1 Tax=Ilumatobacter sp. TaxID=1967498 RepID=UPI0026156985|nr:UDP-N-acetylmuramate dehydrogenase [Ilumatobacter sp.]MDJ0770209.1 UDP-N-acetylmuramate dehydrogenase [Ilumatobacter sp.]
MSTPAAAMLERAFGDRLRRDVPLGPMTTYRVGGPADHYLDVASIDDLARIAAVRAATGLDVLVIGRGSNMLVADDGFPGLAISLTELAGDVEIGPSEDGVRIVTAGAGVMLPKLARQLAAAAVTGFEWAVGVPGSIGGAIRMNAGGHGSDMASSLIDVRVFDLADGTLATVPATDVGLRFRASSLSPSQVVVDARLRLADGDREESEREIAEIVRWRREHQPGGQNCGSVFVNPVPGEVAAGALIDALGLRGFRIGSAYVSEKHANFIMASEGGTATDVRAVMEAVRQRVADATGHRLRSEVRLVGFDDADPLSFDEPSGGRPCAAGGAA